MLDSPDVAWIPKVPFGHTDNLLVELKTASATDAVISTHGNIHLRAGQYQKILHDGQLNTDVMTAFSRLLDKENNQRHCKLLPPGFYEALTINKFSLTAAAGYTQKLDIF